MAAPICHDSSMENPSPAQLRAACSLLDIGYGELARMANVSVSTVKRAMGKGKAGQISQRSMCAICLVLANTDILFVDGGAVIRSTAVINVAVSNWDDEASPAPKKMDAAK